MLPSGATATPSASSVGPARLGPPQVRSNTRSSASTGPDTAPSSKMESAATLRFRILLWFMEPSFILDRSGDHAGAPFSTLARSNLDGHRQESSEPPVEGRWDPRRSPAPPVRPWHLSEHPRPAGAESQEPPASTEHGRRVRLSDPPGLIAPRGYGAILTRAASKLPAKVRDPFGTLTTPPGSETVPPPSSRDPAGVVRVPLGFTIFIGALRKK